MASETFRHSATATAPPEVVWRTLQDPWTWARIAGVDEVGDASHDGDGNLLGFGLVAAAGGRRYPGRAATVLSEAPARMVVDLDSSEVAGRIEVAISPEPAGSRLDVAVTARSKGFLSGILFPVIAGAIGRHLPEKVEALASSAG